MLVHPTLGRLGPSPGRSDLSKNHSWHSLEWLRLIDQWTLIWWVIFKPPFFLVFFFLPKDFPWSLELLNFILILSLVLIFNFEYQICAKYTLQSNDHVLISYMLLALLKTKQRCLKHL
jgi:hypothetical protein